MSAFVTLLDAFTEALNTAEDANAYQAAARRVRKIVDSLTSAVDALPAELRPSLPTTEEVARLAQISGAVIPPELREMSAKVTSMLSLGTELGIEEEVLSEAKALSERYATVITAIGGKRSATGASGHTGVRALRHPLSVEGPEGFKANSGAQSGSGDWTWARWQIHSHARDERGTYVPEAELNRVRDLVKAVDASGEGEVDEVIEAGNGEMYRVQYPAN